jgi:type IV secretory pathway TrbD component
MTREEYPDRDDWPRYRGGIRHAGTLLIGAVIGAILVTIIGAPLFTLIEQPWRAAVEGLVIGLIATGTLRLLAPR